MTTIEPCAAEELSVEDIRKRAEAFDEWAAHRGKGGLSYELQAIGVLLARIDELEQSEKEATYVCHEVVDAWERLAVGSVDAYTAACRWLHVAPEPPPVKPSAPTVLTSEPLNIDCPHCKAKLHLSMLTMGAAAAPCFNITYSEI